MENNQNFVPGSEDAFRLLFYFTVVKGNSLGANPRSLKETRLEIQVNLPSRRKKTKTL